MYLHNFQYNINFWQCPQILTSQIAAQTAADNDMVTIDSL